MFRPPFTKRLLACSAVCGLLLAGASADGAAPAFEAPACGARIFVVMGLNQNYPRRENMRVPRGDLYLDGVLVASVSKDPEIAALDVPAGTMELSWVPSSYDDATRRLTKRNSRTLTLAETATAFVALDWYDDTPNAKTVGYRTEVVEARDSSAFAGKRISFRRPLKTPCAGEITTAALPSPPSLPPVIPQSPPAPNVIAPVAPVPAPPQAAVPAPVPQTAAKPAPPVVAPEPRPDPPEVSEAFMASLQSYYVVNAKAGAPAFATPSAAGPPLYTFADGTELKVVDASADKRWLTVQLPGNKTGYVSSSIVTSGVRAPK